MHNGDNKSLSINFITIDNNMIFLSNWGPLMSLCPNWGSEGGSKEGQEDAEGGGRGDGRSGAIN